MIDDLYNQAIINQNLRDDLHLARKFRNSVMHASNVDNQSHYQHIIHDLKGNIKILEQAIDKLQNRIFTKLTLMIYKGSCLQLPLYIRKI